MVWENVQRIDSTNESVCKYVFTCDGSKPAVVESVLYKYPTYNDRTVICCSTQSGCPVGCRFCGTGDYFVRSLTAGEIVEQVKLVLKDKNIDAAKIKRFQIMFMSMGEPMLNYAALEEAIVELNTLYPEAALLISTSAPDVKHYITLRTISCLIDKIGLQFSVHESTDSVRDKLIPFDKKLSLGEIAREGELWHEVTMRKPFFNYCVHEGNSADEDARRLLAMFDPDVWECTVSVICERDGSMSSSNSYQTCLALEFANKMAEAGYSTRMFNPAGQDDIGGGCGQLWYVQDWMKDNPHAVKASIGRGMQKVHKPVKEEK